jgi:hypothetical protein
MEMLVWRKFLKMVTAPIWGSLQPRPYLELPELSLISYVKPMENILPLKTPDWDRLS